MTTIISLRKAARAGLLGLVVAGLGACSTVEKVLDVDNPAQLDESLLQDEALLKVLVGGVVGDFQNMYSDPFVWRGSMFTDEQITGVNWEQTARLSQRIVKYDEGDADLMFSALSRARAQADSIAGRMKNGLSKDATKDPELAMVLAYAGYSYIVLADAMCEATVNIGSTIHKPVDLYKIAIDRFNEAMTIANAAGAGTTLSNKRKISDLISMINVGLSRANLNVGNNAAAMAAATKVPAGFYWWVEYNDTDTRTYNVLETRISGANHTIGVHPNFIAGGPANWLKKGLTAELTDPRVQHEPSWATGHNALSPLYKPKSGLMFSNYNGATFATGGKPTVYERGTDIAMASYIEAMQNYYEAAGAGGTGPLGTTLEFVNARRAVGKQAPVNLSGDALMAELRWQRGKDLFMGGYRLGDLRRWLRQGKDLFPKGAHPTASWGEYGDATCYPMPLEEYEGNPNIKDPHKG